MNKVILYNVIDMRTNKFHSVVIIKGSMTKWFIPAEDGDAE